MSYSTNEATDKITVQPVLLATRCNTQLHCHQNRSPPIVTWKFLNLYSIRSDGSSTANYPNKIFNATFVGIY